MLNRRIRSAISCARPLRCAALAVLLASAGVARTDTPPALQLQNASPEQVARELSRALGAPVEVKNAAGRTVTVEVPLSPTFAALDRVAASYGAAWRMKLHVRGGGAATPTGDETPVEKLLAIGLQDISATRAFTMIARELNADLLLEGDLSRRVSIVVVNVPADIVLDRIAEQAHASWRISYEIRIPDAPKPGHVILPPPEPITIIGPTPPTPTSPTGQSMPVLPSGAEIRTQLWDGINRVVRTSPDQRDGAIQEFLANGEHLFQQLSVLSPLERRQRLNYAVPVLASWRRMYRGLAPDVKKQLEPVSEFLENRIHRG